MTSYVESLLVRNVKLSSIDESKLTSKRVSLSDSLELTKSIAKELETQTARTRIVDSVGVVVILSSLVSDIVRDSLGEMLSQENPLMKIGLAQLYDRARDQKWQGNRYEKEIASIKKNAEYLETIAELDKTGMWKMTIAIHKNMAMNVTGLIGCIDDAKEIQLMLANSIKALRKNIEALEKERKQVDFYLETGDGGRDSQRFTPAQQPELLNRLH